MLDQRRGRQVPQDFGARGDTLCFKAVAGDPVGHASLILLPRMSKCGGDPVWLPPHEMRQSRYRHETVAASKRLGASCHSTGRWLSPPLVNRQATGNSGG